MYEDPRGGLGGWEMVKSSRGAISAMVGLALVVLLGSAAIAVDIGHLMNVRAESQRVADLSALAGAAAFVQAPGPTVATTADAWAKQYALQNTVDQSTVGLVSSDINIDVPNRQVQVTVNHTATRGNAIGTIFARIIGVNAVDVVTTAVAEASPVAGVTCILPLFLVDQWEELGGLPLNFDIGIDRYEPYVLPLTGTHTGYDQTDVGMSIIIKPANGPPSQSGAPNPGWYYPFDASNIPGGANYREAISGCTDPNFIYTIGLQLWTENGAMIGPTRQGFQDLINQDPIAAWDLGMSCIVDQSNVGSGNPADCRSSPRLRPAPMFDPGSAPGNGKKLVTVTNFAGVFVDKIQGNDIYIIFAGWSGVNLGGGAGGAGGPGGAPPIVLALRLIG